MGVGEQDSVVCLWRSERPIQCVPGQGVPSLSPTDKLLCAKSNKMAPATALAVVLARTKISCNRPTLQAETGRPYGMTSFLGYGALTLYHHVLNTAFVL